MLKDKKHKTFVYRIKGSSIYYSSRNANKDADRFLIIKDGKQIYDYSSLVDAILLLIGIDTHIPKKQIENWIEKSKEFDGTSTSRLESWLY